MWAGDTMTEQDCTPMKHSVDFEVQGQPRANTSPDAGAYVSGANDPWSSDNPPSSNEHVPGVLSVGSACFDRVVYFTAEAEACPVDKDTGLPDAACTIAIDVTEIESDTCIHDRTTRSSCDAQKRTVSDLVPILGKFTVKGQVQIYGRCVSPHSFGTVGWSEVQDRITNAFKYRESFREKFPESPYGDHCIGGGAACLVNGSAVGLAGVAISFADAKQGVTLPTFCDPDPQGCTKEELTKEEILSQGPGARYRSKGSYVSPLAKNMWGDGTRRLSGRGIRRRDLAKGDKSDGGDVAVKVSYHDDSAPVGSKWTDITGTSPAATRLVSSVLIDFTIENVRAADAGWAKALVADVLGGGDPIAQDFGAIDFEYLKKRGGKMDASANSGTDNDPGGSALGVHDTCGSASEIAAALKNEMRPMFAFAHVEFVADSFQVIDEYEPCGLSPGLIAGIVIGSLAGLGLLIVIGCCVGRSKGKCWGDRDGKCMNCYSKTAPAAPPAADGVGGASGGGSRCTWFRGCCDKCKLPRKKSNVAKSTLPPLDADGRSQANSVEMGRGVQSRQASVPRGVSNGQQRVSVTARGFQSTTSPLN
jgi:hypothetical protein